ncbi:MAG: asparagine synthase (glutamine-hydrolyzing) [Bacteroidia bacterium]
MCGIAGYLSFKSDLGIEELTLLTDALSHRGPDAQGLFQDEVCGLGHRRLSVIDLSTSANQPMFSENNRYVIVYNGEVYNFKEIAQELNAQPTQKAVNFKTSSDTEIILEAFSRHGTDFVHLLNGMFAIAIWDKQQKELFLFRDRIGIKPIYYYHKQDVFVFASELKAIKKIKQLDFSVNHGAIPEFLHMGFISSPRSIYSHCYKVQPGHYLKINREGMEVINYWNLPSKIHRSVIKDEAEALTRMQDLLQSAVRYQLRADVPMGVFLSGGIDSSLLTAEAVHQSASKISTFSIGFEENKYNELEYARAVSKHLQTNHHEFIVSYKDALELLSTGMETYDEPHVDSSILPTMIVSRLARKHVTVTLSGDGGDELFMGYGTYQWAARMSNPLLRTFQKPIATVLNKMPSRYQRFGKMIDASQAWNLRSHIFSQEQYYFSSAEISSLVQPAYHQFDFWKNFEDFEEHQHRVCQIERTLNPMEKQSYFDLLYYLPEDLLTKVDRASMHYSLETRVPLLDHRIIEFALNLSTDLKFREKTTKHLLKKILYQYVSREIFERPKQGFSIPMTKWLRNELAHLQETYLNETFVSNCGFVHPQQVSALRASFMQGNDYLFMRIWQLICLHKWAADQGICQTQ